MIRSKEVEIFFSQQGTSRRAIVISESNLCHAVSSGYVGWTHTHLEFADAEFNVTLKLKTFGRKSFGEITLDKTVLDAVWRLWDKRFPRFITKLRFPDSSSMSDKGPLGQIIFA